MIEVILAGVCLGIPVVFLLVIFILGLVKYFNEASRTFANPNWWRKTQADYENAYDERFPGTPYSLSAAEEREKADRSTEYWQEQYRRNKK